jgi:type VI secretion system protein ImpC
LTTCRERDFHQLHRATTKEVDMGNGRMQFDTTFGRSRLTGSRPRDEEPFCILVLADLSGRGSVPGRVPFAQRRPVAVDFDNLDAVFARLAPRLDFTIAGAPLTIEFRSLEDFHPDRLFERLGPFGALRRLRAELNDPATFRRAAQALGAPPASEAAPPGPEMPGGAADLERLLGKPPAPVSGAAAAGGFDIDRWLRTVVAPHIGPDATEQRHWVGVADAAIAAEMRRVLHHPSFQALEATWRGIDRLVRGLETGETLQIFLFDAPREDLEREFIATADEPAQSALWRQLCGSDTAAPDARRWSLLVGDYAFGASIAEASLVAALGAIAAQCGAPLLAAARLDVLGCAGPRQLGEPQSWTPAEPPAQAGWNALRTSAAASSIGLALPRILARLPYGAGTDPIESFAFEEFPSRPDHDAYLWGNPAFALALLAGQAFQDAGWDLDLARHVDATGLPTHVYRDDGEARQQPCAEVLLSESAGEAILRCGIMPFLSFRHRDAARLLRWQSIADPAEPLRGPWSTSAATPD